MSEITGGEGSDDPVSFTSGKSEKENPERPVETRTTGGASSPMKNDLVIFRETETAGTTSLVGHKRGSYHIV